MTTGGPQKSTAEEREESEALVRLGVEGRMVTRLLFSFSVELVFGAAGYYADLVLEAPFLVRHGQQEEHRIEPEDVSTLAPALSLLRRRVDSVSVSSDSTLVVAFEGGISLLAAPTAELESWSFNGNDGSKVICLAEGGLAYWTAR